MTLLKNGITDLNTGNPDHLNLARDQLVDLAERVRPRVNTNDYIDLPEAKTWITQAWSGDMASSARSSPTPALNALASIMLASSLLAVALGTLVYRRFTRGERGRDSAVQDLAAQV
jgi:hypothetical protein